MNSRFSRQRRLSEVGSLGQQAIVQAKVLVVGMGGLGCPAAQYLAAAGVGELGLVDGDKVEESNLARQILYSEQDIGSPKVEVAALRLRAASPGTQLTCYYEPLTAQNAYAIIKDYDLVLDCTDSFEVKYLLNDICLELNKRLVLASATGFDASLMVVNGHGPCLRCLYPQLSSAEVGSCDTAGVLGAFVGVVGAWQAAEALKLVLKQSDRNPALSTVSGRVLFFDFFSAKTRTVVLAQKSDCVCARGAESRVRQTETPLVLTIGQVIGTKNCVVVDVRSHEERATELLPDFARESIHIPFREIVAGKVSEDFWLPNQRYIFFCTMGKRSAAAAQWLREHGVQTAYSVEPPPR